MCGAPQQTVDLPAGTTVEDQSVIQGVVLAGGEPVPGAYVRLLDASGEFTAEVVSSPTGTFRFYAAPGAWTVRALSRSGNGDVEVTTEFGIHEITVTVES